MTSASGLGPQLRALNATPKAQTSSLSLVSERAAPQRCRQRPGGFPFRTLSVCVRVLSYAIFAHCELQPTVFQIESGTASAVAWGQIHFCDGLPCYFI